MPEAVASNSRAVPERQQVPMSAGEILDQLEEVSSAIYALGSFLADHLFHTDEVDIGNGVTFLFGQQVQRLNAATLEARRHFDLPQAEAPESARHLNRPIDSDVFKRVSKMVHDAYFDLGKGPLWERDAPGNDKGSERIGRAGHYYNLLMARLEGETHLLDVGSLFPWLELTIRRDLGQAIGRQDDSEGDLPETLDMDVSKTTKQLRDELISHAMSSGQSATDIAQALNLRRVTVERMIGRLMGETDSDGVKRSA